jgi:very-short-patch-repair endonuclease
MTQSQEMRRGARAERLSGLSELLDHQDGVISLAQALTVLSRKAVRHRVATGRWQLVHRAVYVTHNGPIAAAQLRWAVVLAVGDHAVLGGLTAAQAWGLRGYESAAIHLLLPASHHPRVTPPGVVLHRSRFHDDRDVLLVGRPPRTRAARSLVDAAQWARSDDLARSLIATGFQQRLVTAEAMSAALDRAPRIRRRPLIEATILDASGGAHSLAELDFLQLCRDSDLPEPSRQVVRRDASGRRRYLDAYFAEWRLHVEIDGSQHLDVRQAWADMRRQNDLWIAGDRVLRFPAWALRAEPQQVIAQVRDALIAAGWRG